MQLYSYYRSSAAFRVRIGLNLKGLAYETVPVHLLREGGENLRPEYRAVNPQARIPALGLDDGQVLVQSMAILEYLDEIRPEPPIMPKEPVMRARVRGVAQIIACDIHPLNNNQVLDYLRAPLGADKDQVHAWYGHWITMGFHAVEALIEAAPFCFGAHPTLADIVLVPQVYNARRFKVDLAPFPKIRAVDERCRAIGAFGDALPEKQPDAE